MLGVTSCGSMPRYARTTLPFFRIWSITWRARFAGNREADALAAAGTVRNDGGVDADQFAAIIDERAAGISRD